MIFLYPFCYSFHDKIVHSFIFLSDCDGQVENNGVFQHFHLGVFVKFLCFCQHAQQIPDILSWEKNVLEFVLPVFIDNFSQYFLIRLFPLDGLSFEGNLITIDYFFLTLVDHHISIFDFLLDVIHTRLATISLLCQLVDIEFPDSCIVELEPFIGVSVLDDGVVVTAIGVTNVDDKSFENVVVVFIWKLLGLVDVFGAFLLSEVLLGVLFQVEVVRELAVIIDFQLHHSLVIELEPFEGDDEMVG